MKNNTKHKRRILVMKNVFAQNPGNTVVAYYRCASSISGTSSIEKQKEEVRRYADAHDYRIVKEYIDYGRAGRIEEAVELQCLLSDIEDIKPACLIITSLDRLTRDIVELSLYENMLREAGVDIVSTRQVFPRSDCNRALMEAIWMAMEEIRLNEQRERIRRGKMFSAEQAHYLGKKIVGYSGEKDEPYTIDTEIAPAIRRAFEDCAKYVSLDSICAELNNNGIKTSGGAAFNRRSLRSLLRNRAYIGEYRWGDIVIPNGMPAIVDRAVFEEVQEVLKR